MDNNLSVQSQQGALDLNVLLILVAVFIAGTAVWYVLKREHGGGLVEEKHDSYEKIKAALIERIDKDAQKLQDEGKRFFIRRHIDKYDFSPEVKRQIKEKYPFVYATPFFPRYMDLSAKEITLFEEIIKDRIKNYEKKDLYTPLDAYQTMLLEEAEKEAKKILHSYEENKN